MAILKAILDASLGTDAGQVMFIVWSEESDCPLYWTYRNRHSLADCSNEFQLYVDQFHRDLLNLQAPCRVILEGVFDDLV